MKTNLKKTIMIAASAIFILALAFNINTTLDDPFSIVSQKAFAMQTSSSGDGYKIIDKNCDVVYSGSGIVTVEIPFQMFGKQWKVPVGYNFDSQGEFRISYEDVGRDCMEDGPYSSCQTYTCAQFHQNSSSY